MTALGSSDSEWAAKQVASLKKMSPTSMAITLEQIRRGATMNIEEVLTMEHGMASQCMEAKDFYEGIRAVLVDRDNNPQWDQSEIDITRRYQRCYGKFQ